MIADSFDSLADLWGQRLSEATRRSVSMNRSDIAKVDLMRSAFTALADPADSLVRFSLGSAMSLGLPNRELADILNFVPRFFGVPSAGFLHPAAAAGLTAQVARMHGLGIVSHLLLYTHTARHKVPQLNSSEIIVSVLTHAAVADRTLASYNAKLGNAPTQVAHRQFSVEVRPFLRKSLGVGFWKLGKLASHIQNVFWMGSLLAMQAELLASQK